MIASQNFSKLKLSREWARTKMIASVFNSSDQGFWESEARRSSAYPILEGFLLQGFHDFLCLSWVCFPSSRSELDLAVLVHSSPESWFDRDTAG